MVEKMHTLLKTVQLSTKKLLLNLNSHQRPIPPKPAPLNNIANNDLWISEAWNCTVTIYFNIPPPPKSLLSDIHSLKK